MVYGSDEARAAELRTMSNGELKTSANGLNMPYNKNGFDNAGGTSDKFFLAGKETDGAGRINACFTSPFHFVTNRRYQGQ